MHVFVRVTGQEDNIGDIILRRQLLQTAAVFGHLNLFTGEHTSPFIEAMASPDSTIFTSHEQWLSAMLDAARQGPVLLFDKPGELHDYPGFIGSLLKARWHRAKLGRLGGHAVLLGVGMRHRLSFAKRVAIRVALSGYELLRWRDVRSREELGFGEVMPDWAFGEVVSPTDSPRNLLVISMRGDRPMPSPRWFELLRSYAATNGLRIVVATQVGRDHDRSIELADGLGVQAERWIDGDYDAQESALRELYRASRVVVSDRMHVLIVAAVEGAAPLCLTDQAEEKIERHFKAIDFSGVSRAMPTLADGEIIALLKRQEERLAEMHQKLSAARRAVASVEQRLRQLTGQ